MEAGHNFKIGDYNAICDRCGFKYKASQLQKERHTKLFVCKSCWDIRNPQDFLKGYSDKQTVAIARPEAPDEFV